MQFEIFDTIEDRQSKIKKHDDLQMTFLPVNPLQEKHITDEPTLTNCEFEIMQMVLSGHAIPEIALKIFLSIAGVKYRLTNIYWKFNVINRLGLIKKTSSTGIQFRTRSGVKHTFHNSVNLRAHEPIAKDNNDNNKDFNT